MTLLLAEKLDGFTTRLGKDFIAEVSGLSSWLLTSYVMVSRLEFDMIGFQRKD